MHVPKTGGSYQSHCEWAFEVPTTPREKLVLLALAARPGADAQHLIRRTGMTYGAVKEALEDLLTDGWIYKSFDGGYLTDVAAEEMQELPQPESALARQLAHTLARSR